MELRRLIRALRLGAWAAVLSGSVPLALISEIYFWIHPPHGIVSSDVDLFVPYAACGSLVSALATWIVLPWLPSIGAPYRRLALAGMGALLARLCATILIRWMGGSPSELVLALAALGGVIWGLRAPRSLFSTEMGLPPATPRAPGARTLGAALRSLLRGFREVFRAWERYVGIVVAGTSAFLLGSVLVGSPAYAIFPGLGGTAPVHDLERNLAQVVAWATFAAVSGVLAAFATLVSVRLLEWSRLPRLTVACAGACIAGFATAAANALDTYIGLSPCAAAVAIALAVCFGALAVPIRGVSSPAGPIRAKRAIAS